MENRKFIKTLLFLAVPIIVQNLIGASINLLDNVMVGNLGEDQIAAIGIANQYYIIFFNTANGFVMGAGVFISQYWGKREISSIHRFVGISLITSMICAILFSLCGEVFTSNIIKIFSHDKNVINYGTRYLSTVTLSYVFTVISLSFGIALRGTEQTRIPMYASFIGLCFNGILNYGLIFGKLGLPNLGIVGAGVATIIARFVEMSVILITIYWYKKNIVAGKLRDIFDLNIKSFKKFFPTALPIVINDIMWTGGVATYFAIYSILGTNATATMQICGTVNTAFNIFGIGIAAAGSIMLGNLIGADKMHLAQTTAKKVSVVGIILGAVLGVLFFIISPYVIYLFKISKETQIYVVQVLRVMAIILPIRFYGIVQIVGVLRAGGDVMFATLTELIAVWGIGVPMSYLGVKYFGFSITVIYILTCLEEVFKSIVVTFRLFSGKWIRSLVKE